MSQTMQFDGYTVRPVEELDRVYLEMLIRADAFHRDKMDADFFLKPMPGETAWALEDAQGKIVFYFKTTPAVRMAIQFAGEETLQNRAEIGTALMKGLAWLEANLAAANFRELLFDVDGPELKVFAKRRLGFVEESNLMVRPIAMLPAQKIAPESVGTVPTGVSREGG